jgi:hypothetical protein
MVFVSDMVFCHQLETIFVSDQKHWRQKTISETNIVEYVEFLQRQKTISGTNFVSDQRQKRQISETKNHNQRQKPVFLNYSSENNETCMLLV